MAVIKNNILNGGDNGYTYCGNINNNAGKLSATLDVDQWNSSIVSMFGPLKKFQLSLVSVNVSSNGNSFDAVGTISGVPGSINLHGTKVSAGK